MDDLVTVATFPDGNLAQLARARLEAAGIEAMVVDAENVATPWRVAGGAGELITLAVRSADAARASAVLGEGHDHGE